MLGAAGCEFPEAGFVFVELELHAAASVAKAITAETANALAGLIYGPPNRDTLTMDTFAVRRWI